jgi:hypothetical protein
MLVKKCFGFRAKYLRGTMVVFNPMAALNRYKIDCRFELAGAQFVVGLVILLQSFQMLMFLMDSVL